MNAITFSQGQLHGPERRRNFGENTKCCMEILNKSPESLSIRSYIPLNQIEQILDGRQSLTNDTIVAISSELCVLPDDLFIHDKNEDDRRERLLRKLHQTVKVLTKPKAAAEVEVCAEEVTITCQQIEGCSATPKEEVMDQDDIWNKNDNIATINGTTIKLHSKNVRKTIADKIKCLKRQKYPSDTWPDLLARARISKRADNWIHNLSYGTAKITGTEVETFAELFKVSVWEILSENANVATAAEHDLTWNADGLIATDSVSGVQYNLGDKDLYQKIAARIRLLCPASTTPDAILQISVTPEQIVLLDDIDNGASVLEEVHIEAFAEFFNVSDFSLITGEGLTLPEFETLIEEVPALVSLEKEELEDKFEAAASQTQSDAEESVVAIATPEGKMPLSEAMQLHFKQLVMAEGVRPHDGTTWEDLFRATHVENVDWCYVYLKMTYRGIEVLAGVSTLTNCMKRGDVDLNAEIARRTLSLALTQQ